MNTVHNSAGSKLALGFSVAFATGRLALGPGPDMQPRVGVGVMP